MPGVELDSDVMVINRYAFWKGHSGHCVENELRTARVGAGSHSGDCVLCADER